MNTGKHPGNFRNCWEGDSSSRMANRDLTIKIEFKIFSLRLGMEGRSVWWSERTRNSSYMLDFDLEEARWISIRFKDFTDTSHEGLAFQRYRGKNAVFTIQRYANKRGSFLELSKYNKQGRKLTTIVPCGFNKEGWRKISNALDTLLLGCYQKRIVNFSQQGVAPKTQFRAPRDEMIGKFNDGMNKHTAACARDQKIWKDALIITRNRVNSSWALIERVLGQATKRKVEIFPFEANKALWWPLNAAEFSCYNNLRRGFFDFGISLDFEGWTTDINKKDPVENCCNSWIWIYGLTWDLWTPASFQAIGARCGGLLAISPDTLHFRRLGAAKIKVKGTADGFLQTKMNVPLQGKIIEIRIRVETFDHVAYEKYDSQTYAQVLVNGKKILAGWGNNNLLAKLKGKEVLNENVIKGNSSSDNFPVQNMCVVDLNLGDQSMKVGENSDENQGISTLKVQSNCSKVKSVSPMLPYKKKVLKILRKIDPKHVSKFNSSSIESANSQQVHGQDKEVVSELYNKFGKMYCRRKKLLQDEGNEDIISNENSDKSIHSIGVCRNIGVIDSEDAKEEDFDDSQDDLLKEEYESSDSDSFQYFGSEYSEFQEEDLAAVDELLSPTQGKNIIPNPTPEVNSKPFVGQVLDGFQSSFLNNSFLVNAILPSSFSALGVSSGQLGGGVGTVDGQPGNESYIQTRNGLEENTCAESKGLGDEAGGKCGIINKTTGERLKKEVIISTSGVNYDRGSTSEGSFVF